MRCRRGLRRMRRRWCRCLGWRRWRRSRRLRGRRERDQWAHRRFSVAALAVALAPCAAALFWGVRFGLPLAGGPGYRPGARRGGCRLRPGQDYNQYLHVQGVMDCVWPRPRWDVVVGAAHRDGERRPRTPLHSAVRRDPARCQPRRGAAPTEFIRCQIVCMRGGVPAGSRPLWVSSRVDQGLEKPPVGVPVSPGSPAREPCPSPAALA